MSLAKAGTAKRVGGITNPATLEKLAAAGWEEPAAAAADKAAAEKAAAAKAAK